ncbi:MAG: ribose-phosphate diphosphokinase [Candidatus Jordarchaeaceae archaeon]
MKVLGGPGSLSIANKISKITSWPLIAVNTKRFPDGEFYFKLEERIIDEEVLIVQSLYPPQDTRLIELLIMLQTVRDFKAKAINVFIPYLAYSRQDERYLEGECLSASLMSEILEKLGANTIYTIDVHNQKVLNMYKIPAYSLSASGELAKYFLSYNLKDPLVVSPDAEEMALKRAENAAKTIGAEYDFFEKSRDRRTGEIVTHPKNLKVKDRDAIIIDDIVSTGKTSANVVKILKDQGARRVFIGVSHALLLGNALEILTTAGVNEIVGTDSVINSYAKVSVAPILVKAFRKQGV